MATNYVLVDFENVQPDMSALAGSAHRVIVFFGAKQQTSRHHFDKFDSLLELGSNLERVKVPYSGKNALDMHIAFQIGRIFESEPGASFLILSKDTDFDPLIEYLKSKGVRILRSKDLGGLAKQAASAMPAVPAVGGAGKKARQSNSASAPAPKKAQAQRTQPQRAQTQRAQPQRTQPQKTQSPRSQSSKAQPPTPLEKKPQAAELDPFVKQLRSMTGKPSTRKKLAQTLDAYFKHHGGGRPASEVETAIDELIARGLVAQTGTKVTYTLG